jgi:hypothetical protein
VSVEQDVLHAKNFANIATSFNLNEHTNYLRTEIDCSDFLGAVTVIFSHV